jgi:hypothetical protein
LQFSPCLEFFSHFHSSYPLSKKKVQAIFKPALSLFITVLLLA